MQTAKRFSEIKCNGQFQASALYELMRAQTPPNAIESAVERAQLGEIITLQAAVDIVRQFVKPKSSSQVDTKADPMAWASLRNSIREVASLIDEFVSSVEKGELDTLSNELLTLTVRIQNAKREIGPATKDDRQHETSVC